MTHSTDIIFEQQGLVGVITLNRPEKLNSLHSKMQDYLLLTIENALNNPQCRVLLLTGAGKGFCAGQDLSDPHLNQEQLNLQKFVEDHYNQLITKITQAQKPIVCYVNGIAAGAGANMAFACDIILVAQSARFNQAFVKIGLSLDSGGSWFLPKMLGIHRAKALALTGDFITSDNALDWGIAHKKFPDDTGLTQSLEFCQKLALGATNAMGQIKQLIHQSFHHDLHEQLRLEAKVQGILGQLPEFQEGTKAFREKRHANFIN